MRFGKLQKKKTIPHKAYLIFYKVSCNLVYFTAIFVFYRTTTLLRRTRPYTVFASILMLSMLLFIQVLQVKHVFTTVHQTQKASHSQRIVAYELGCPICEYLVHQQPTFAPFHIQCVLKPAEFVRNAPLLAEVAGSPESYTYCLSNKSPPALS